LLPTQLHNHGPVPVTDEALPARQRLVLGALVKLALLEVPQEPFTGVSAAAEQLAVVPPFNPPQDQVQGPEPLTVDAVPALHKLVVGALESVVPFEVPHDPFTRRFAEHDAVVPPPLPAQLHDHGPLPVTVEALPARQRLVVGALVKLALLDVPQAPYTGVTAAAEQLCVVPPFCPAQDHVQGPDPLTAEAVPALHKLVVGALESVVPFEEPHDPFTRRFAEHDAVVPPPLPAQLHDHGPLPFTVEAVPVLQRLVVGFLVRLAPSDVPHVPVMMGAETEKVVVTVA